MVMYWTKNKELSYLLEFKTVDNYKYLGGWLDYKLSCSNHLIYLEKRLDFLLYKLYAIRSVQDIRLNINLFVVLFMPVVKLGMVNTKFVSFAERKAYKIFIRKSLKRFCLLPLRTPNSVIRLIYRDID